MTTAATSTSRLRRTTTQGRSRWTRVRAVVAAAAVVVAAAGGGAVAHWTLSAAPSPTSVARRHQVTVTAHVKASIATRAVVRVDVYDPTGHLAFRHTYSARTYRAGSTVTFRPVFYVSGTRRLGTYTIKIRILSSPGGTLLYTKTSTRTFRVRA